MCLTYVKLCLVLYVWYIGLFTVSLVAPQIPTHYPPSSGSEPTSPQAKRRRINSTGVCVCVCVRGGEGRGGEGDQRDQLLCMYIHSLDPFFT